VHLQSFLQRLSLELDELNASLSVIAEKRIPKERKEQLAYEALPDLKRLRAFVDGEMENLHSLAQISRHTT
jgi:hypothetical protein